jgi:cell division protein FtsI/penicillin-binding protein 2
MPRFLAGIAVLAAILAAVLLAGRGGSNGEPRDARSVAAAFAARWSAGDDEAAAAETDAPGTAARAMRGDRAGLDRATVRVTPSRAIVRGRRATTTLSVRWSIPHIGVWGFQTQMSLRMDTHGTWRVHFAPTLAGPYMTDATRLGTETVAPPRADILDRDGSPLVRSRPVVEVGLQRDRVADVQASARALATAVHVDAAQLTRQVEEAGPREFVLAITLRPDDFKRVASLIHAVPGAATTTASAQLAPSRDFARALLGAVAPATAEQIAASRGRLESGEDTGQWGLEQRFDAQLSGTAERRVVIRDPRTGVVLRTLHTVTGAGNRPLRTTLSIHALRAAEAALGRDDEPQALVVVQPSTGDVLAVANRPSDSTFDRALAGTYAPGSTFKIVTAAALLRSGLTPASPVACPPTTSVDGRRFHNFEGEASGAPAFALDFAISCNTAFIGLTDRLHPDALSNVARDFGLGRPTRSAVPMAASRVPLPRSQVARAAMMIGQDRISTSPLAMAGVAATVAAGHWQAPRLLLGDPSAAGPALPPGERDTLASLMRGVVTHGTGTALASIPGAPAGKTGTAEFGSGEPPPTRAWFVALRGDLALAVLVEHGVSGSAVAAPIAARFLADYGSG